MTIFSDGANSLDYLNRVCTKLLSRIHRRISYFFYRQWASILFIWGNACIEVNIPSNQVEAWVLLFLGIPFIGKGIIMAFFSTNCTTLRIK